MVVVIAIRYNRAAAKEIARPGCLYREAFENWLRNPTSAPECAWR